jgi:hypothetical protein
MAQSGHSRHCNNLSVIGHERTLVGAGGYRPAAKRIGAFAGFNLGEALGDAEAFPLGKLGNCLALGIEA